MDAHARLPVGLAGGGREARAPLDHGAEVLGRGAAAAPDHGDAVFGDEPGVVLGELLRGEVVVHPAFDHRGQTGVGQDRDRSAGPLRQVAQVLAHLGRAGGAVEADDVGLECVDGGERGADLGAHEHAAGGLDGDLHLQGDLPAGRGHGPPAPDDGGLGLEQVLDGLDDEEVDTAFEQSLRRLLVAVPQVGESDLAEGCDLRPRPERTGHPSIRTHRAGHIAGDARRGAGELPGAVAEAVLGEHPGKGPELSVSTTSHPTSKNERCRSAITSGRVSTRISLHPSR